MYNAILLTNKNETKCGLQNKNYAKMSLHFRWPKRDETKCYNVISSRLVALLLFLGMHDIYRTDKLSTDMGENDVIFIAPINKWNPITRSDKVARW